MSNNFINEKKKALLAYKEKILEEVKYYEKSIDNFRANHKNNSFYDDHVDSSDSEDDFPPAHDTGPTIVQLKLQQAMMKTCLQATQELTSLMVLQSEINMLVEEPKFEGERPVAEAGTWREVTAECRIDLVPFTVMFFMHIPDRKFGAPSYRGLRIVPVKNAHEIELAKSVLHSLKLPSDAIEVLKSYASGYRSRRTTLARLANKYANTLFMEPHAEGGFVLKCADLLEISWRLENKWSPVAPFHHRMKFDLEYMDETYLKIITQAHKELLDPALQTDERTLLLAKIISTCLEARGPVDPESDLESKTTERDNDIDNDKRDSEVMAPPKSLPKKIKQKSKDGPTNSGQKRSMDDENGVAGAKKMRNDIPNDIPKKSISNSNMARKSKLNDDINEGGKKRKTYEALDKNIASAKNVKEANKPKTSSTKPQNFKEAGDTEVKSGNTKSKEIGNTEELNSRTKSKNKNVDDAGNTEAVKSNTKSKNKIVKDVKNTEIINNKAKPKNKIIKQTEIEENNAKAQNKNIKESASVEGNAKSKTKVLKDTGIAKNKDDNMKPPEKNTIDAGNEKVGAKSKTKIVKEPSNIDKVKNSNTKPKNITNEDSNEVDTVKDKEQNPNKTIEKNKPKNVNAKSNEITGAIKNTDNINAKDAERPKSKVAEKKSNIANTKNTESNPKPVKKAIPAPATKAQTSIDLKATSKANAKNNEQAKITTEKNIKNKDKVLEIVNKDTAKNVKDKETVNSKVKPDIYTVKEKNATTTKIKDKLSPISNTVAEKNDKNQLLSDAKVIGNKNIASSNVTVKITKEITNSITQTKKLTKEPMRSIKIASHRNALKAQNQQKTFKTDKEIGVKSKIPQKKFSPITESAAKKNPLRISPRKMPSKFKSSSQENTFKQKMIKTTNIPRLLKKPAPKTSK